MKAVHLSVSVDKNHLLQLNVKLTFPPYVKGKYFMLTNVMTADFVALFGMMM